MNILETLLQRRAEIDRQIEAAKLLQANGLLGGQGKVFPKKAGIVAISSNIAQLSVFRGTVELLKQAGKPLSTREIIDGLLAAGKDVGGKNPENTIGTTLHKAVRMKKQCAIKKVGRGKWALRK